MHRYKLWLAAALLVALPMEAQRGRAERGPPAQRGQLEQRFRERLAGVMRERLGLNDDQMRRLGEVNRRFEGERRILHTEEMQTRRAMRQHLMRDSVANQDSVAILLERGLRIERRKVELFEAEQRELSQFLTPVQRARYLGMQEQLRSRIDDIRERRRPDEGGGPPGPPPRRMRRPA